MWNNRLSDFTEYVMGHFLKYLFNDAGRDVRSRIFCIYALLIAFNVGAWVWAFVAFYRHPSRSARHLSPTASACVTRSMLRLSITLRAN